MTATAERLNKCKSFDNVFEIVKRSVSESLNLHRAGLTLIIADLPGYVGAFHVVGSNAIVLNKAVLRAVEKSARSKTVEKSARSKTEVNSYIYYILLHEYLHSLGYTNEAEVRTLVRDITRRALGEDHFATLLSSTSLLELFPDVKELRVSGAGGFEVIVDFDKSSMPYIG